MSEYIILMAMSMLPVTELRLTVPYGILYYNLHPMVVVFISIIGNFLICIPIVYFFKYIDTFLQKYYLTNLFLKKIYSRTRSKSQKINKYKYVGLIIFVGIPAPITGAWTGCLASHLFGFSNKKSLMAILIGLFISATIVLVITISFQNLLSYIGYESKL